MAVSPPLVPMLIGGERVTSDDVREVRDPEDGRLIAYVAVATLEQLGRALEAAEQGAKFARGMSARERAEVLRTVADTVENSAEEFARTIASEGIKTIREARKEVARCAITLRLSASEAERMAGETIPFDAFAGAEDMEGYWIREPVGVVAAITPFNDPLNLVAHKVGPAIASGNAVIVKPHSETPLSALQLGSAFHDAGLPAGVMQVVPGAGTTIGDALVRDDRVRMISFTGGRIVGDLVARAAGAKKSSMELGSNGATIVVDDADLDDAIPKIVAGAFWAAGQNCLHVQRLLIGHTVYDEVRERLIAATEALQLGPKLDEASDLGCLINQRAAARVSGAIATARADGARLLTGGSQMETRIAPTLIEDVADDHALAREEIFGPVTILRRIASLDEGIKIANSVPFALQNAVFTRSLHVAQRAARELEGGGVVINDSTDFRIDAMPFGGTKASGFGREGVRFAVESMTEPKVIAYRRTSPARV